MVENVKMLYRYRELLWMWTLRNMKVRYKQSFLGGAWAILQPLSLMVVFTVVFSFFVQMPSDGIPYPVFSYVALLPWTFFTTSVSFGVPSLVNNMNLVTKIYFPREILPLASVAAAFVDFGAAAVVFVGMMLLYRIPLTLTLLAVPLLLALQILLTLGVVLLASAINVFYRDVRFIVPLALQLWLYASPVIYPVSLVPQRVRWLYQLNPMVGIIDGYRQAVVSGRWPDLSTLLPAAFISCALFPVAYHFFKRVEMDMADII